MSERERTDADADLEFDFFEDLPTTERGGRQPPPPPTKPKRSGRPPIRPRAPGGTPLLRLAALVVGAIALAVIVVFWVTSCRGDSAKGTYEDYMGSVGSVVQEANEIGSKLGDVITSRGATLDDIDTQLNGLAQQQAQLFQKLWTQMLGLVDDKNHPLAACITTEQIIDQGQAHLLFSSTFVW